jgi:hypothetical protein
MRKIIDGKTYNTETAAHVCDVSGPVSDRGNFHYDRTDLYRSPKGQYFIAGHGGPLSCWAVKTGQSSWSGGDGLRLIEEEEARALCERHASAEVYQEFFGEPEEG